MEEEELKRCLKKIKVIDRAGNTYKHRQATREDHWIALKTDAIDVFITLGFDIYDPLLNPCIKVLISIEDEKLAMRNQIHANCLLRNGIAIENNYSRPKDLYQKMYDWTDERTLENQLDLIY